MDVDLFIRLRMEAYRAFDQSRNLLIDHGYNEMLLPLN